MRAATSPPRWPPIPSATAARSLRRQGEVLVGGPQVAGVRGGRRPQRLIGRPRGPCCRPSPGPRAGDGPGSSRRSSFSQRAVGGAEVLDPELAAAPEDTGVDRGGEGVVVERHGAAGRPADGDLVAQLEDAPAPLGRIDDAKAQRERLVGRRAERCRRTPAPPARRGNGAPRPRPCAPRRRRTARSLPAGSTGGSAGGSAA